MTETLHKHPDYEEKAPDWDLCSKLFEGKHSVVCVDPSILWPHAVENGVSIGHDNETSIAKLLNSIASDHFARRSQRTRWLELPEIIASLIISFMFRKPPNFAEVSEVLGEQINNVDGKGNSLYSFIKNNFALDYLKYGKAIIKVESSKHSAVTMADEVGANVRPYMTSINPLAVTDWELQDGNGLTNYKWLRYEYNRIKDRARASEKPESERISKVYYKENQLVQVETYQADLRDTSDINYNWTNRGMQPLGLSRIPFVVIEDASWLKGVNQESLRYHNIRSSKDNQLYSSCYRTVFIFGADVSDANQLQAISESTWPIIRDPAGKIQVIDPADLSAHEKALDESLNNVFKVGLNQLRILPSDSKVAQAADSLGEEKDNTIALIESTLEDIENGVNEAISLWAEYKGVKDFKGKIQLDKKFSKDDITKFITVYNSMRDQFSKYETVMKSATKKGVRELGFTDDEQEAALAEIDAGPTINEPIEEDPLNDAEA